MLLKSLQLNNFRSYTQRSFTFDKPVTVLLGPNAIGKTNIIEAITLLALGVSFRTQKDEEMIKIGEEFGRISADIDNESLEIVLTRGMWQGKKVAKKRFLVSGVAKRRRDFLGKLPIVIFEPTDIDLVIGSPSKRRSYLNSVLSQIDNEYYRCLLSYEKGLRQRNRLLQMIIEGKANIYQLEFWDMLLIRNGTVIYQKRRDFLEYITNLCQQLRFREELAGVNNNDVIPLFEFRYNPSPISKERLVKYHNAEIASGNTLVGPHRDDFAFWQARQNGVQPQPVATYGSRGEQRMILLALKLAELDFVKQKTGQEPLLLLDDIFSELDRVHQHIVLRIITKQQTIITTTELDFIDKNQLQSMQIINLA